MHTDMVHREGITARDRTIARPRSPRYTEHTRPAGASIAIFWTGRFVFSSNGDLSPVAAASAVSDKPPFSWWGGIAQSLFATIFPSECRLCDGFLTNISDLPVCNECLSAIDPLAGTFCLLCGERLTRAEQVTFQQDEAICANCRKARPVYSSASAYGSYDGNLRELLHLLKFEKVRPAAKPLGKMLAQVIARMESAFVSNTLLVVPVPLHPRKLRERGFNQAELIARTALKHGRFSKTFKIEANVLLRQRITESQIGLSEHQRRENLRGAFKVVKSERVRGKEALLVDDVFTTGTTVSECARVLRRAGATKVYVVTVARTLKTNIHGTEGFQQVPVALAG